MSKIIIYADGGCRGNGKLENVGAYGVVLFIEGKKHELKQGYINTTNQEMELLGCIGGLQAVPQEHKGNIDVEVYSDSAYVVNCFKSAWHINWRRNGWRNANCKPVANRDLWEQLLDLVENHFDDRVTFKKVKGHSGDPNNERADELATDAMNFVERRMRHNGKCY